MALPNAFVTSARYCKHVNAPIFSVTKTSEVGSAVNLKMKRNENVADFA
jgi:hypothetical protein